MAGTALILTAVSGVASAMSVPDAMSTIAATNVEKVVWCNGFRCGVGLGLLRPRAVGGVWHPWGYGARPYRWCYYHPRQC